MSQILNRGYWTEKKNKFEEKKTFFLFKFSKFEVQTTRGWGDGGFIKLTMEASKFTRYQCDADTHIETHRHKCTATNAQFTARRHANIRSAEKLLILIAIAWQSLTKIFFFSASFLFCFIFIEKLLTAPEFPYFHCCYFRSCFFFFFFFWHCRLSLFTVSVTAELCLLSE